MYDATFSYMTTSDFAIAEESGSTIDEHLSHEKQRRLYLSEIRRAVEGIQRSPVSNTEQAQRLFFYVIALGWEEELKQSSFLEEQLAKEFLPKRYLDNLLHSWKCGPEIDGLISRIRKNADILHAGHIAQRLNQLWKMSAMEEPYNYTISSDSLRSAERFFSLYPLVRYPDITLTPNGNVYARWRGSDRSVLSIQFMQEMKVRFVVFAPNQKHPDDLNRISGTDFVDTIIENLNKTYEVENWVLE